MPTFVSAEIANPNLSVDTFAPTTTALDVDGWLNVCVSAGTEYAYLTTKHHDGFALWPTAYHADGYAPYSIAQTAWYAANGSPDIVGDFVAACRAHGIKPGLYISAWDLTFEARTGTNETTNAAGYIAMIETQLTELLTNYGDIMAIWIDGWAWHLGYDEIPYSTIYNFIKSIQPNCLVVENSHTHPTNTSQIEVFEQPVNGEQTIPVGNLRPAEMVATPRTDGRWFYNSGVDQTASALRSAATILGEIANANDNNATFMLALTPDTAGVLPLAQVDLCASLGA
jgi:alpha-L-fucosidase